MLVPMLSPVGPSTGPPLLVAVRGVEVALSETDPDGPPDLVRTEFLFVGTIEGRHCWAVDVERGTAEADGTDTAPYVDLMRLFADVDEPTWAAAGRAVQLVEWARCHRFCGRCGQETVESPGERARRCPHCGLLAFPRLAPAVIMLVEREDGRALLARNARWPGGMYSCLAGFVEPGETVEAAVRREVHEEVSISIDNLRYHGSQPWPFPHSLMIGFHVSYAGGEICCDDNEIADARWFAPDDLPGLPGPISIARRLIDDWVARSTDGQRRHGVDQAAAPRR
jgi:NAD+ diphosphatase